MALTVQEFHRQSSADRDAEQILNAAHQVTVETKPAEMAAFFQHLLGQRLTAFMTASADPKAIGKWASGSRVPRPASEQRLRDGFHVAMLLSMAEDEATARAWLLGMNPALQDRSPLSVIRESPEQADLVMGAARAYLAHG